jgi:hypothetical protein
MLGCLYYTLISNFSVYRSSSYFHCHNFFLMSFLLFALFSCVLLSFFYFFCLYTIYVFLSNCILVISPCNINLISACQNCYVIYGKGHTKIIHGCISVF